MNDDAPIPGRLTLVGQYDSPFVRRVGIALTLAGIGFEHLPWSVFADGKRVMALNPLMRVPTLVLEDGTVLVDSHAMLDHIDRRASAPLRPAAGAARDAALRLEGLAVGMAEKAVALFYEKRLHADPSADWMARSRSQIEGAALALESEAGRLSMPYFHGEAPGHADIALGCAWRFLREVHPGLLAEQRLLSLVAHCAALERLPAFRAVAQPFLPPT
jgi:glutathione S-transferase